MDFFESESFCLPASDTYVQRSLQISGPAIINLLHSCTNCNWYYTIQNKYLNLMSSVFSNHPYLLITRVDENVSVDVYGQL